MKTTTRRYWHASKILGCLLRYRKQAQRTLNLDEEIRKLNQIGIMHAIRSQKDLEEASGAYKNIDTVMKNQSDLVEILVELFSLAVIKR